MRSGINIRTVNRRVAQVQPTVSLIAQLTADGYASLKTLDSRSYRE